MERKEVTMPAKVKHIPSGHHSVTPYLIVKGATEAIEFYKTAFGAVTAMPPMIGPNGRVGHAELKIGNSIVMLADEFPDMNVRGPESYGGSPVCLHLYVDDVDKVARQVVAAGGKVKSPVENQFYGDRMGTFTDPYGHTWNVATHVEDVEPKELKRRADEAMKKFSAQPENTAA
jgi:PhnB protein